MHHQNVIPFSKAGTFTETRPDGTVVTYEMEVEEFEEEVCALTWHAKN